MAQTFSLLVLAVAAVLAAAAALVLAGFIAGLTLGGWLKAQMLRHRMRAK